MNINLVNGDGYRELINYNQRKRQDGAFGQEFLEKVFEKSESGETSSRISQVQVNEYYQRISTNIAVLDNGRISAGAVIECSARNISYTESDNVKVSVEEGFVFKAQVHVDEHLVYIEQKNEDGTVKGYEVDPLKLAPDTENPIEQMALESWDKAKQALAGFGDESFSTEITEDANAAEDTKQPSWEEALADFYDFVEDRIKNGPPKYRIGSGEWSIEEWQDLIEKIDEDIEKVKEEQKERIKKQKEADVSDVSKVSEESIKKIVMDKDLNKDNRFIKSRIDGEQIAPYSLLADENGIVTYKGVQFVCDDENNTISLGDMSNPDNVMNISLPSGGTLRVNYDNLGDLAKAIDMFSPEDINAIMRAIAQDKHCKNKLQEIEYLFK